MRWFWKYIGFILALLLVGCGGAGGLPGGDNTLTPTPPVPVFGDFFLGVAVSDPTTANGQIKSLSLAGGGIVVEETRNVLSDIRFRPESGNGDQDRIDFPGNYIVKLIGDGAALNQEFPDFPAVELSAATYREFEMRFERLTSNDIPSELLDDPLVTELLPERSFVVTGHFQEAPGKDVDGDGKIGTVPFQILSDNKVNLKVESPNVFTVSETIDTFFFIAFRIEDWFDGLLPMLQDLTPADLSDGVAVIQKESPGNRIDAILERFEANTEVSCKSAPSDDANFEESDVDEDSSSGEL